MKRQISIEDRTYRVATIGTRSLESLINSGVSGFGFACGLINLSLAAAGDRARIEDQPLFSLQPLLEAAIAVNGAESHKFQNLNFARA